MDTIDKNKNERLIDAARGMSMESFWSGQRLQMMRDMVFLNKIGDTNAFLLFIYLRADYMYSPNFSICYKSMAKARFVLGWEDWRKYHKATEQLIKTGIIERISKGEDICKESPSNQDSKYIFVKQLDF